mgnify:CR=1 FL=1
MKRYAGVLLPVTSLPSKYGIGCFDQAAYDFVDWLQKAGQRYWQILPLGATSYGSSDDSPYQAYSAFAGNPYLISLDALVEEGVLTREECDGVSFGDNPAKVDFDKLHEHRFALLHKAYERSGISANPDYQNFIRDNGWWLNDYALFMALKTFFHDQPFRAWPEDIRMHWGFALEHYNRELYFDIEFQKYMQFKFNQQWSRLKAYANGKHIQIVGDIPIYVSPDGADVWAHPELFQLDAHNAPTAIAGCPPDAFAEDGQVWGNPLYNWNFHRATDYAWWVSRMWYSFKLYDVVRIDHFRGFDTYWAIPADSATAKTGKWENGPGMELFEALEAALGQLPIIAEDLGELFPSVRKLLADSTFPGMKVLQFAFSGGDNEYLPHNHVKNSVVYPGTHDNTTITAWWESAATPKEKATAAAYLHLTGAHPTAKEVAAVKTAAARTALLRAALGSVADRAIIPMYDWLGLGEEAHLNTPGKLGGNWAWRAAAGFESKTLAKTIADECSVYCRV